MRYTNSIINGCLGNILEWYDFGLFTIFSGLFGELFFPASDPFTARMATFSIFAVSFIFRPLGALLFGYWGDKFGRAKTLRFSLLMVIIPSLLIGILPTYASIGIAAPILLIVIRILQGISIGGEYSGNMIYLGEIAPSKHRALFVSLASCGANVGILLAMLGGLSITFFLDDAHMRAGGWRILYLASGILCFLIYQFRIRLQETHVFRELKYRQQLVNNPITYVFKNNFSQLLQTIGLVCMGTTFYFFCFVYLPAFLKDHYLLSLRQMSLLLIGAMLIMILVAPCAGLLCDKIGKRRLLLFNACIISLCIIPGFYFFQTYSLAVVVFTLVFFTLASAFEQGTTPIALIENFPGAIRYTGLSLGYNLGNGILGGTIPLVCGWLLATTHWSLAPALYVTFYAILTGSVVYFCIPTTKGETNG